MWVEIENCCWFLREWVRFIPMRGCGLKCSGCRMQAWCNVHPHAGVWVEILVQALLGLCIGFIPIRGVGWKFGKADSLSNCFVHPYAGMRVVIPQIHSLEQRSSVHPPCGGVGWNSANTLTWTTIVCSSPRRGRELKLPYIQWTIELFWLFSQVGYVLK